MERRHFLMTVSGAGLLSMLDPAYLSAKERLQSGKERAEPVPKRPYGRAEDVISESVKQFIPEDFGYSSRAAGVEAFFALPSPRSARSDCQQALGVP